MSLVKLPFSGGRRSAVRGLIVGLLLSLCLATAAAAQSDNVPTYTVQAGDTLSQLALKYNLTVAQLAAFNSIANPNLIVAGQQLKIPTVNPTTANTDLSLEQGYTVLPGDTLFIIASQFGLTVDELVIANNITNVDVIQVGQQLVIPSITAQPTEALPEPFASIELSEARVVQGRTLVVSVSLTEAADLRVDFEDRPVYMTGDGQNYWGIVGIHALQEVGVYSLAFHATLADGSEAAVAQNVVVVEGPYSTENIDVVPGREGLLSTEVIQNEFAKVSAVWNLISPTPYWEGAFGYPVENTTVTSGFGTRRSYNSGPATSFHAGTDFGVGTGVPIYAPTAGVVVLAEALDVRGNAVLIDHGLGLVSGYWHQSEIVVEVGQTVAPGDLIGYVGDTGLVTGAHLHWEMRLGGIAVEPLQWVVESLP